MNKEQLVHACYLRLYIKNGRKNVSSIEDLILQTNLFLTLFQENAEKDSKFEYRFNSDILR